MGLYALATVPFEAPDTPAVVSSFLTTGLTVLGVIYVYRCNGGASGKDFLERFFSIGWVVAFRFVLLFIALGSAVYAGLDAAGLYSETTTWYEVPVFVLLEILIWWQTGRNLRDISDRDQENAAMFEG